MRETGCSLLGDTTDPIPHPPGIPSPNVSESPSRSATAFQLQEKHTSPSRPRLLWAVL